MILGGQHTPFWGGQHAPFWGGQIKPILGGQYERFFQWDHSYSSNLHVLTPF